MYLIEHVGVYDYTSPSSSSQETQIIKRYTNIWQRAPHRTLNQEK